VLNLLRSKGVILVAGLALMAVFAIGCGEIDNNLNDMPAQDGGF